MSRTTTVLALVAVLAIAISAPALGNGESLVDRAFAMAQSARQDAGVAKRQAAKAKRQAAVAKRMARQSQQLARRKAARGPAGPAGPAGPVGPTGATGPAGAGAAIAFAEQAASVSTDSNDYVALGGPSVEVDVPASGLIEVAAQATLPDGSDDGAVALFEDGSLLPGQATDCGPAGSDALFSLSSYGEDTVGGTPATLPMCATLGAPAAVRFVTTPGRHTYELRYALCCSGTATFENRRLWVTPLP